MNKEQHNYDESNRLIAEFMGWESNKYDNLPDRVHKITDYVERGLPLKQCDYHKSWNLLMPVAKACLEQDSELEGWSDLCEALTHVDIEFVYKAILVFLRSYNAQKTEMSPSCLYYVAAFAGIKDGKEQQYFKVYEIILDVPKLWFTFSTDKTISNSEIVSKKLVEKGFGNRKYKLVEL
jgi:hypothetical protein